MKKIVLLLAIMAMIFVASCGSATPSPVSLRGSGKIAFVTGVSAPVNYCISMNNNEAGGYINIEYPKNNIKSEVTGLWIREDGSQMLTGVYTDSSYPNKKGTMILIITNSSTQNNQTTASLEFYMSDPVYGDYSGSLTAEQESSSDPSCP